MHCTSTCCPDMGLSVGQHPQLAHPPCTWMDLFQSRSSGVPFKKWFHFTISFSSPCKEPRNLNKAYHEYLQNTLFSCAYQRMDSWCCSSLFDSYVHGRAVAPVSSSFLLLFSCKRLHWEKSAFSPGQRLSEKVQSAPEVYGPLVWDGEPFYLLCVVWSNLTSADQYLALRGVHLSHPSITPFYSVLI